MISTRIIQSIVSAMLKPIQRKLALTITRGTITAFRRNQRHVQAQATLLDDETTDWLDVAFPIGYQYGVIAGTPCMHFSIGGSRSHGVLFPMWESSESNIDPDVVRIKASTATVFSAKPDGNVYIGGAPNETIAPIANASLANTNFSTVNSKFNAHTHSLTVTAGMLVADLGTGAVTGTITVGVPGNQPMWSGVPGVGFPLIQGKVT